MVIFYTWDFSYFIYPVKLISWECALIVFALILMFFFCTGYKIIIKENKLKFYETIFFLPILRFEESLNKVIVSENDKYNCLNEYIYIYKDSGWDISDDYIIVKFNDKEYQIGTSKNLDILYNYIEKAINESLKTPANSNKYKEQN